MKKYLLSLFTFIALCSLLQSQVIEYNIDTTPEMTQKVETKTQIIKVSYAALKEDYIKIMTVPTVAENMATMFVSKNTEKPDVNNFSYLAREKNVNTIYVPKPYLKEGQVDKLFFHIGIECINNCDYKIIITFEKTLVMAHDTKYLFFTDESAPTLTLRVMRLPVEQNSIIMIYALGGHDKDVEYFDLKYKDPSSEEKGPIDIKSENMFYNGQSAVFDEKSGKYEPGKDNAGYYELTLTTAPKSYIALGVRNMGKEGELIPYEVTYGLINKDVNKRDCFRLNQGIPTPGADYIYTLNVDTYTQNAYIYLTTDKDADEPTNPAWAWTITDPSYIQISKQDLSSNLLCLRIKDDNSNDLSYSLHLVDNNDSYNNQARNLPRLNGLISTHFLGKSEITFYRYYKRTPEARKVSMHMKVIQGNPIAYAHVNKNYPDFRYSKQTLLDLEQNGELIKSHRVNDFFSLIVDDNGKDSLVSTTQNVLIIQCLKNEPTDEDCIFQLSFNDNKDSIVLRPNTNFASFLNKGEKQNFSITILSSTPPVEKFLVNLYSFSGDSGVTVSITEQLQMETEYVGNKQIVTVSSPTGDYFDVTGSYTITVDAFTNTYYSLNFIPIILSTGSQTITIESGSALLETIPKGNINTKTFLMKNKRNLQEGSFVTTFFPLNCKVEVKYIPKDKDPIVIPSVDDFFQHELTYDPEDKDKAYLEPEYKYIVSLISMETQVNSCMVYISGNEILAVDKTEHISRELVLNEASNYQIILTENTKKMSYLYPHPAIEGEVIAIFSLEEGLALQVTMKVESTVITTVPIKRSRTLVFQKDQIELGCKKKDFLCNIILEVSVVDPASLTKKQKFDVQIRSKSKTPGYLKKNYMVLDIMEANSKQYYYTEIEHNEEGELSLNYKRGSGKMMARLIPKNVIEPNPDWNGKIVLPNEQSTDLLKYNDFMKKIIITNEQTKACTAGCDLYIGITSEDNYDKDTTYLTDYSIYYQKQKSPINIDFNEFINGHILDINTDYDIYQITIPYDTPKLRIDFQSQVCVIYGKRGAPDGKKYDWKFDAKKNNVFIIDYQFKKNDVIFFSVYSELVNAIISSTYIIKFDIPALDRTDLILINSDQNILCQTKEKDSYCYFLFPLYFYEQTNQLSIYGYTDDYTTITIYATHEEISKFDSMTKTQIEDLLPKKGKAMYSSENNLQKEVLTISDNILLFNVYVIIGVHVPIPTVLTLVTTFRTHIKGTVLNPVSMQMFVMEKDKSLELSLPDSNIYLVNFLGLVGKGSIDFDSEKYAIANRKNLALISSTDSKTIKITSTEKFIFSVYYNIRSKENYDEIENATTNEIRYKGKDLPLVFYSKVYDENEDIIINININDLKKTGDKLDDFDVLGVITSEAIVNKRKGDKDYNPPFEKKLEGNYDISINSGKIYFKSMNIKEYTGSDRKYLYVSFNKKLNNNNVYSDIRATISTTPSGNYDFPIAANNYFHYTLTIGQVKSSVFLLSKNDKSERFLKLEFSSNSNLIDFVYLPVNTPNPQDTYKNSTDFNIVAEENKYGKRIILFDLEASQNKPNSMLIGVFYLSEGHKVERERLSNYALKYSTSTDKLNNNYLKNDGVMKSTFNNDTKTLKLNFGKAFDSDKKVINAKYILRLIPYSEFESLESYTSITLLEKKNPSIVEIKPSEGDGDIEYVYEKFPDDRAVIVSLLATTPQGELLMYTAIEDPAGKNKKESDKSFPLWLIILIAVIAVLVLVGVIGIFFYVKKLSNKFGKPEEEIDKVDTGKVGLIGNE